MKTYVHLRAKNQMVPVEITSKDKPKISTNIEKKWQNILDIATDVLDVPAGLIMRITKKSMQVFLKSKQAENPYEVKAEEHLGSGLYCETVIGKSESLEIEDALLDPVWVDNPDVELNMIGYYGYPIKWPDGEFFGTICVLHSKKLQLSDKHKQLLKAFTESVEKDLEHLVLIKQLKVLSYTDALTNLPNRRFIMDKAESWRKKAMLGGVVLFDINDFKAINDQYGHDDGDEVLNRFAQLIEKRQSAKLKFGRVGGDEFLAIFKTDVKEKVEDVFEDLKEVTTADKHLKKYRFHFEYGLAFKQSKESLKDLYKRADENLRARKKDKYR